MAIASILLSVAAMVFAGLGVLLVPIPTVGAVFAFGAPALALAGAVLGGSAMSERRKAGKPTELPLTGVILNALAFFPALLTALTCGMCNALCSGEPIQAHKQFQFHVGTPFDSSRDAAVPLVPGAPQQGHTTGDAGTRDPKADTAAPPPVFPPPPLGR